jgi:hypothetical protein
LPPTGSPSTAAGHCPLSGSFPSSFRYDRPVARSHARGRASVVWPHDDLPLRPHAALLRLALQNLNSLVIIRDLNEPGVVQRRPGAVGLGGIRGRAGGHHDSLSSKRTAATHSKKSRRAKNLAGRDTKPTHELPWRSLGPSAPASVLALESTHTCRDGERRDCRDDHRDSRQCKTYAPQPHWIGHAVLRWKVLFFLTRKLQRLIFVPEILQLGSSLKVVRLRAAGSLKKEKPPVGARAA